MRAAGIPARVIGGYQGGEINPLTGSVLVHQFDAHAWAEVWLQGRGWVRVDPTAQVSPERIENSIQDIAATANDYLTRSPLSAVRFKNIAWFNRLRMQFDAIEYRWASFVLQYKGEKQISLLNNLLGAVTVTRIIMLIAVVVFPIVVWIMYGLLRSRIHDRRMPEEISYQQLCKIMTNIGFNRDTNEGPIDFAKRVEASSQPIALNTKHYFLAATRLYVALMYEPQDSGTKVLLRRQLANDVKLLAKQSELRVSSG